MTVFERIFMVTVFCLSISLCDYFLLVLLLFGHKYLYFVLLTLENMMVLFVWSYLNDVLDIKLDRR